MVHTMHTILQSTSWLSVSLLVFQSVSYDDRHVYGLTAALKDIIDFLKLLLSKDVNTKTLVTA